MSPEGYAKLKDEFKDLTTRKRKEIAAQIEEARSHGDLSENAEYDAAKEAQNKLENRIAELEQTLSQSRILDDKNMDSSKVYILSTVTLLNKKNRKGNEVYSRFKAGSRFSEGKISIESPIGSALMGKVKGDIVDVKVPAGNLELEILNIER